jgi:hypothetical protein
VNEPLTPVQPTEDMRLPAGSAVFQVILGKLEDGSPNLDMRAVLIGGPDGPVAYDPLNPAHRLVAVIGNRIDDLLAEATGTSATRTDAGVIERRLQEGEQPGAIPEEGLDPVSLSRGTPAQPMPHELAAAYQGGARAFAQMEQAAQQGMVNLDRAIQHELTETEAVRQDKLASLALQYSGNGNPAEPQAGFEATGMEQVREQAPWPFGSGPRDGDEANPAPLEDRVSAELAKEAPQWPMGSVGRSFMDTAPKRPDGTPYGTRDPDFDIADRQEGKGGSGLHPDD